MNAFVKEYMERKVIVVCRGIAEEEDVDKEAMHMDKRSYEGFVEPGKVWGNIYYVGIHAASTHLIDTADGLIVIDPGYPDTFWIVLDNIKELGFDVRDIKIILISHGHHDHAGGTRELVRLSGAKSYIGKDDYTMVNGTTQAHLSKIPNYSSNCCFEPDVLLSDGDIVSLGNTSVLCLSTPGHTDGTMSFFFDATDGERTYRAGMHGGSGTNTLRKEFLEKWQLPFSNREKFIEGLKYAKTQKVDIFLGNHVGNNDTEGKLVRVANGEQDAFYCPGEWERFLDSRIARMNEVIALGL